MTLFAYTGDEDDDHFAQAFSQSRLLKWQGSKEPKGDHQVDPSTISNDLASKKIWEMEANAPKLEFHPPSLYSNSSQHSLLGAESLLSSSAPLLVICGAAAVETFRVPVSTLV